MSKSKKMKKDNISSPIERSILERDKSAKERAAERKKLEEKNPENDALYHFFMSMYEITKKMPPVSQHIVRMNVFQAVSHEEARMLNLAQPTTGNNAFRQLPLQPQLYQTQDSCTWANVNSPASFSSTHSASNTSESASYARDTMHSSASLENTSNLPTHINHFSE
jgi:hypothetical protein